MKHFERTIIAWDLRWRTIHYLDIESGFYNRRKQYLHQTPILSAMVATHKKPIHQFPHICSLGLAMSFQAKIERKQLLGDKWRKFSCSIELLKASHHKKMGGFLNPFVFILSLPISTHLYPSLLISPFFLSLLFFNDLQLFEWKILLLYS